MTITPLENLLEQVYSLTEELEQMVIQEEGDPESWVEVLDKRQEIIDQLTSQFQQGDKISDERKTRYLLAIREIEKRMVPVMEQKKREMQSKMVRVQKNKIGVQQYNGYNTSNAYGAFFDQKK
jgi:flagellar protein FliT